MYNVSLFEIATMNPPLYIEYILIKMGKTPESLEEFLSLILHLPSGYREKTPVS
jgi:hypothetical protein